MSCAHVQKLYVPEHGWHNGLCIVSARHLVWFIYSLPAALCIVDNISIILCHLRRRFNGTEWEKCWNAIRAENDSTDFHLYSQMSNTKLVPCTALNVVATFGSAYLQKSFDVVCFCFAIFPIVGMARHHHHHRHTDSIFGFVVHRRYTNIYIGSVLHSLVPFYWLKQNPWRKENRNLEHSLKRKQ